ncbi:21774_t:CDS:2, partial [Dentiscutata erythropus]
MTAPSEVEDIIKRLQANKHVQEVLIINDSGQIIKSSMDSGLSKQYSDLITKLIEQTVNVVKELDDT